ncbi:MAG: ParA family protein [Chloroflexi bacterium]|nr:ParA family protein [Chloroflexota bacterium]MBI3340769.1 ParA family protein [Chloroflexota bacterium]
MSWNNTNQSPQGGGQDTPVSILLAHKDMDRTTAWYQALQVDARFRVMSMANAPQDFRAKLASSPEIILLDATVFDGPSPLIDALTSVTGAVYLIVPGGVGEELIQQFKSIPSVKSVSVGDLNIADFTTRAYSDALALRRTIPVSSAVWSGVGNQRGGGTGGLRIVTVWSRSGGTGRTTIAAALAQSVARRGLKTLLIGLGSPDPLPLQLGLHPEPNIISWMANPTDQGLRTSIQTSGDLHVLAGFSDIISEAQGSRSADSQGSINELVTSAAYGGYSAIFLDTPSAGDIVPRALSAANTWLMIARPTVSDVWMAVEAFRTVTQKMAGHHRITPGNIFVALNQRANGQLTADQWHSAADAACRKMNLNVGFPPVMATIPYSVEVPLAQDNGRSLLDASDDVARPVHRLAEMLFGGAALPTNQKSDGSVMQFGPLKIRTKK